MGEAKHHRHCYRWKYKIGFYSISGKVRWIKPSAEIKAKIKVAVAQKNKEKNGRFEWMLKGSGEVAAMVRMALAMRSGIELFDDFVEVEVEPSNEPELEDLVFS